MRLLKLNCSVFLLLTSATGRAGHPNLREKPEKLFQKILRAFLKTDSLPAHLFEWADSDVEADIPVRLDNHLKNRLLPNLLVIALKKFLAS